MGTHVATALGLFRGELGGARFAGGGAAPSPLGGLFRAAYLLSVGNIVFWLILGALLMAVVAIDSPETLSMMLGWARSFKGLVTGTGLDAKCNIWLELLLEERQLLPMLHGHRAHHLAILAYPIVLLREKT